MTIPPAHMGEASLKGHRLRGFGYNSFRCRNPFAPEQARHDLSIVAETLNDALDDCSAFERDR